MRRRGWAMVPRTSASSCDGAWPSIPFLFRGSVGCATSLGGNGNVDRDRLARQRDGSIGSGAEVVTGHRYAWNLLADGPFDRPHHRDLVRRHEGIGIAG